MPPPSPVGQGLINNSKVNKMDKEEKEQVSSPEQDNIPPPPDSPTLTRQSGYYQWQSSSFSLLDTTPSVSS